MGWVKGVYLVFFFHQTKKMWLGGKKGKGTSGERVKPWTPSAVRE